MSVGDKARFYEGSAGGARRSAPAALRNRDPIADVLAEWLPERGLVLEVASGTGEHALHFARRFPKLEWQPSDPDPGALESIMAWAAEGPPNLRPPLRIDADVEHWPIDRCDAMLNINMAHISPWTATLGLLAHSARVLSPGSPLTLYGPWITERIETAPSNLAFDADLKRRNPQWGLRRVEDLTEAANTAGFDLDQIRTMPANNLMLRLIRNSRVFNENL